MTKPKLINKSGLFEVTIAKCEVVESLKLGWVQVIEYYVKGGKTLYCEIQRLGYYPTPPTFEVGEAAVLITKKVKTKSGKTFVHHKWYKRV
jgi:hypothetical protein